MLKAMPGETCPFSAPPDGRTAVPHWCDARARIAPVPELTATISPDPGRAARAAPAAAWSRRLSVVCTGLPGWPGALHSVVTCLLYTSDAADDLRCVDLGG